MSNVGELNTKMDKELDFLHLMSKLKHLDRTGWVRKNVKKPESVASHMYRIAVMSAFLVQDPKIDLNKCLKMSIVHDMGESIIGDITPHCGISEEEKASKELLAINQIANLLPQEKAQELHQLFQEYEDGKTPEAKLVKDLDKLDMVIQAYEYEQESQQQFQLQDFFDSTEEFFQHSHPYVKNLLDKLKEARKSNIPFNV